MSRISEIERAGLPLRIAYRIGERMFGVVPKPEKVMVSVATRSVVGGRASISTRSIS